MELNEKLNQLSTLRETKGKEKEALVLVEELLSSAKEQKEWQILVKLNWELHLIWQHFVMTEITKPSESQDPALIAEGKEKMLEFAMKAKDLIEEHQLKEMLGVGYRFLGRAATYSEDHEKAKEYYETALMNFYGENEKSKLEVNGFLAETLVFLGGSQAGLNLGKKTFTEFLNSDLGKKIKAEDYFTWAVWMSGIAPRIIKALVETSSDFNKEELNAWLESTKEELVHPTGAVTWGDGSFKFRMDEINKAQVLLDL